MIVACLGDLKSLLELGVGGSEFSVAVCTILLFLIVILGILRTLFGVVHKILIYVNGVMRCSVIAAVILL